MLAWPSLDALDVDAFVTTRHGGVSAGPYATLNLGLHVADEAADVLVNRRRAAAALGADLDDFVFCHQVHGRRVAVVSAADRGRGALSLDDAIASTDALVTTDPGTVLAILVADCVPIILTDPEAGVLACVHAGWRGTVAGVTGSTLHAMQALGARPERIQAAIGPAVAADRYQVGPEVAAAAERFFGGSTGGILAPGRQRSRPGPLAVRPARRQPACHPRVRGARRADPRQRPDHGQPRPGQHGHAQPWPGVVLQRPGGPPVRAVRRSRPA